MKNRPINPYSKTATYAAALEVSAPSRFLFVSGQVPEDASGVAPDTFIDQCRLAWKNVETQLAAADMAFGNIVKFTIFLSDRKYQQDEYRVRREMLTGRAQPAMTVIITGIYDPKWLLEIEAIAAS